MQSMKCNLILIAVKNVGLLIRIGNGIYRFPTKRKDGVFAEGVRLGYTLRLSLKISTGVP